MIPLWKRKELRIIFSLDVLFRFEYALKKAEIGYTVCQDRHAARGRGSTSFLNLEAATAYRIYVDKQDFDRALYAITSI